MLERTRKLWAKQNKHEGDRHRLFAAVGAEVKAERVLYPGSFVDVAPSFVFADVTYVDVDRRAAQFFADTDGVREILAETVATSVDHRVAFVAGDYQDDLGLADQSFDLLVSLSAGFISEACTRHLRVGGTLLVNGSHGDASLASIDDRYRLVGIVSSRDGQYGVTRSDLDQYLIPKKEQEITAERLHELGRGIGYTRTPFAYLFERVA